VLRSIDTVDHLIPFEDIAMISASAIVLSMALGSVGGLHHKATASPQWYGGPSAQGPAAPSKCPPAPGKACPAPPTKCPPAPGKACPAPQAPAKVCPAPQAPSKCPPAPAKVCPAPQAPAKVCPAPQAPAKACPAAPVKAAPQY
jgi:hypothetical protein